MKFGKKFERVKIKEWSHKYLKFNKLKHLLKAHTQAVRATHDPEEIKEKWDMWYQVVREDVRKLNCHYLSLCAMLDAKLADVKLFIRAMESKDKKQQSVYAQYELMHIHIMSARVEVFSNANKTACRKLLKKHDKMTSKDTRYWVNEIFALEFATLEELNRVRKNIRAVAEHIGVDDHADAICSFAPRLLISEMGLLNFFLGLSAMALFNILILCSMESWNPAFDVIKFMNAFPVFRLAFMLTIIAWACGVTLYALGRTSINYVFLLGFDPKNRIEPESFFKLASLQTVMWILMFGFYLMQYKFAPIQGLVYRHVCTYWYPLVTLISMMLFYLMPSDYFRRKYRRGILRVFLSVILAPVMSVTFRTILAGDMLTSLVKPVKDVQFTVCFYSEGTHFKDNTVCHINNVLTPLILLLPFWFRFLQCLNRVYNSPHWYRSLDLINAAKYLSGIAVTVSTSTDMPHFFMVAISIWATVFMATWDFVVDWDLFSNRQRLFQRRTYIIAVIANALMRCAWVLTIIPTPRLLWCSNRDTDTLEEASINCPSVISEQILILLVSAIEVARRAQWIVFRLENEHVKTLDQFRHEWLHENLYLPPEDPKGADTESPSSGPSTSVCREPEDPLKPNRTEHLLKLINNLH